MSKNSELYINGINLMTGEYLVEPMTYSQATKFIRGQPYRTALFLTLRTLLRKIKSIHLGWPAGVDLDKVDKAGWGVVFATDEDAKVKKEVKRLFDHRLSQIGNTTIVKELAYDTKKKPDWRTWLDGYSVKAGSPKPWNVPYYLLVVGSPERIPFEFGYLMSTEYAVGRLHFDDVEGYRQYINSVIDYETGKVAPRAKEVVFFGPRLNFDTATQHSADQLIDPLADGIAPQPGPAQSQGFRVCKLSATKATKQALTNVFAPPTSAPAPALLFAASHGMGTRQPNPNQQTQHGALICQDWPGFGKIQAEHYFAASDLPTNSRLHGLIGFIFACYSAGTPIYDCYLHESNQKPPKIAEQAFIAALPKAMLSHPSGGALACIGHVELAWNCSFFASTPGDNLNHFQNAITWLLQGKPVGWAMKDFPIRYMQMSTDLSKKLEKIHSLGIVSDQDLAVNWIERNDAEGYIIIGDPAVSLRVSNLI